MKRLSRAVIAAMFACASPAWAQGISGDASTYKPVMSYHGVSPRLDYLAQHPVALAPGAGQRIEPEMEQLAEELNIGAPANTIPPPAPFVQTSAPKPSAATQIASFEGPGTGLSGFSLTGAPPDMTLAVGPNHVTAWVNSQYAVFNKTGTVLTGPVNGNALFTGLGNECATTNRGDPILQYDRLADRWVLSQFAFAINGSGEPIAPYFQCFAVSTTGDPTGTYARYSVQFSATSPSGFNDYGKLGIWPDGYYTAYNMFGGSPAGTNTGAGLCVSDRTKMLVGDPTATTLCAPIAFYAGGAAFLPADMDGTTLPSDTTQGGIFMRLSTAPALRMVKLKPNFAAGTVTVGDGFGGGSTTFVNLALPTTTRACNGGGGTCVPQPTTTNLLDTLGDRLMYRLAFRNRAGVESLLVAHAVDPDGAGLRDATMRWYEIRNPLGNPADVVVANRPVIFQSGTYDPDTSSDRWMGSVAMDADGNIMMGYSRANAANNQFASVAIAGREAADAAGTLQAEIIAHTGTGAQTGTLTRWGDYSTIQTDPTDDRTFWYIGEYLSANGSFNWRTRIVAYRFPSSTATLSINDVSLSEGNSGTTNASFTITRSNNAAAVSVQVDTSNGTATAGSDYTAITAQTVNFAAGGAATATVNVPVLGDTTLEPNETFNVLLSNATNATISDGTGLGTINNDDTASIAINDVTLSEGNSGTTNFTFTATLTGSVAGGFTVPFSTSNGTATAGSDYTAASGTLTFAGTAGETQTFTVLVNGDATVEANETFNANLGAPSNASVTVSDGSGVGTINNDDGASIAINDVTLSEGNSGTTNFTFTATLTGSVAGGFTVPFSTSNGTATAGSDYTAASGTLTFAGTAGETQTFTVLVTGDTTVEVNETFNANLGTPSNAGVTVSDGAGVGTINNDDTATLAIASVTQDEGNAGTNNFDFVITLTGSVQGGVTVGYATANGTATSPADYTATVSTVSFVGTNGEQRIAQVPVAGELVAEFNETFTVTLGTPNVAGVTITTGTATGTIVNDDLFADVGVGVSNGSTVVVEGGSTVYTATITNTSSVIDASGVAISHTASAGLTNLSWTCVGSGGATCPASGTGLINLTRPMPRGSALTFQISANIATGAASPVQTTVSAVVQAPESDPVSANNSATDTDVVAPDALFSDGYE
jgi:hypothetical protein